MSTQIMIMGHGPQSGSTCGLGLRQSVTATNKKNIIIMLQMSIFKIRM